MFTPYDRWISICLDEQYTCCTVMLKFENLGSVYCWENAVSESRLLFFSSPIIDKFQNMLGYKPIG